MTPTTMTAAAARSSDARVIALVGAAHFVSHIYILVLPPLFPFVRADFGVSYTELGIAIAIFNILTGLLQTPAGFLVDRFSARAVLIGGLLLGAASLAGAALVSSFYIFVAMFAFLGVANATYHPADYALLSGRVSPPRMSQAYSIHIFAGFAGTAAAPATLLILAGSLGWRGAFLAAAALGVVVAAAVFLFGERHGRPRSGADQGERDRRKGRRIPASCFRRRSCSASASTCCSRWPAACRSTASWRSRRCGARRSRSRPPRSPPISP